jgi:hypothetical protein
MSASRIQLETRRYNRFVNLVLAFLALIILTLTYAIYHHDNSPAAHGTYNLLMLTSVGPVNDSDVIDYNLTADDCLIAYRAHASIVTPTSSVTFRCEYVD